MREALRHGSLGCLDYDRSFHQQAATDPSMPWNTLVPGLQATTILGNPAWQGFTNQKLSCALCRGVDHNSNDCALAYLYPPTTKVPQRIPNRQNYICTSWNKGNCIFPGTCTFRHVCTTCQLPHKARDCSKNSHSSAFKQKCTITLTCGRGPETITV